MDVLSAGEFSKKFFSYLNIETIKEKANSNIAEINLENRVFGSYVQILFDYELYKRGYSKENPLLVGKKFMSFESDLEWLKTGYANEHIKDSVENMLNVLQRFNEFDTIEDFVCRVKKSEFKDSDIYILIRLKISRKRMEFDLEEIEAYKKDLLNIKKKIKYIFQNINIKKDSKVFSDFDCGVSTKDKKIGIMGQIDLIVDDTMYEIKCSKVSNCKVNYLKQVYMYTLMFEVVHKFNNRKRKNKRYIPQIKNICILNPLTENKFLFSNQVPDNVRAKWNKKFKF